MFHSYYSYLGPEIWEQTGQNVDAFCAISATGGTINGISQYLKERNPEVKTYLVDSAGSGYFDYVKTGEYLK